MKRCVVNAYLYSEGCSKQCDRGCGITCVGGGGHDRGVAGSVE